VSVTEPSDAVKRWNG